MFERVDETLGNCTMWRSIVDRPRVKEESAEHVDTSSVEVVGLVVPMWLIRAYYATTKVRQGNVGCWLPTSASQLTSIQIMALIGRCVRSGNWFSMSMYDRMG